MLKIGAVPVPDMVEAVPFVKVNDCWLADGFEEIKPVGWLDSEPVLKR